MTGMITFTNPVSCLPPFLSWWAVTLSGVHEAEKEKMREASRRWKVRHPDHHARYYVENKARIDESNRNWKRNNASRVSEINRVWRELHQEKEQGRLRRYYLDNQELIRKKRHQWYLANLDRVRRYTREYARKQRAGSLAFRIRQSLATRLKSAVKGFYKSARTLELLGCTVAELKRHLQIQFRPGMTWDNYGEWHIDHIRPCASFDLTDPEQQRQCFNFKNLQPLWAKDNLSKGAKYSAP